MLKLKKRIVKKKKVSKKSTKRIALKIRKKTKRRAKCKNNYKVIFTKDNDGYINGVIVNGCLGTDISHGTRKVFSVNDIVIKINDCLDQSNLEIKKYKTIAKQDKQYFPKVLGGKIGPRNVGYVIQEKLEILPDSFSHLTDKDEDLVDKLCSKYGIWDVSEDTPGRNWAYVMDKSTNKPKPVIFDFGVAT